MDRPCEISAKTLGQIALPGFCPRCFWLAMKAKKLPFQIFPGIFSSIDTYSKNIVQGWFHRHGSAPPWLESLGRIKRPINPPHYSVFSVLDETTSIVLRGTPDGIFEMCDGSHTIIDYKTAKFTAYQDELFPMYKAQLNAYAYIGERRNLKPVSKLALIYTEPVTDSAAAHKDSNLTATGFQMGFSAYIQPVEIKPDLVPKLLTKTREIMNLNSAPPGIKGCHNCAALAGLLKLTAT